MLFSPIPFSLFLSFSLLTTKFCNTLHLFLLAVTLKLMAACGSLEHIFDKPLPEPPTFLESFSPWKHIRSVKSTESSPSFTDIFAELHFKESRHLQSSTAELIDREKSKSSNSPWKHIRSMKSVDSPSSSSSFTEIFGKSHCKESSLLQSSPNSSDNGGVIAAVDHEKNRSSPNYYPKKEYKQNESFSSMNSESLSLCTEGLGFESFDEVEDLLKHDVCDKEPEDQKDVAINLLTENHRNNECSKVSSRRSGGAFPPPISCIGRSGKPWVCFKSYREDGRFILKEIRIPTQEFMHACRENGRLKLQFIQSDDEILEEDEEYEDEDEDEDENDDDFQEQNDDEQCR